MLDQIREQSKIINSRSTRHSEKRDAQREVYRLLKEAGMKDGDHNFQFPTGEKIKFDGISTLADYKSMSRDNPATKNIIFIYPTELDGHLEKLYV